MSVEVRIDPGRIARTLRLRNGVVARRLAERTARTARIAEREAPGSMGRYISWKVQPGPRGLQGVIVCDHPAVRYVLDGTRPHIIRPRKKGGVLRFEARGRVVYSAYVRHPGTRANDFLGRALRAGR
ncbi:MULTISPECIES: hypothetical protein [unclassified Streptomyces]|uniref:hypothetical protein n=1 Tax=unclassified Streptomyces TaxID=2593676 RepID=UPI002023C098|nr:MULTISPECIES: hypothetical protein [unclassified Streptomyces]MCX4550611.1 hypothetical protein [Streptomyces sp. NBC_01500]WSC22056.1 hypothetical protein OIE60_21510 [Streptomyces sp. NBC_01766]